MTWIRDCNERMVNIDNWDVIDYTTISDKNTDYCVAYRICLYRGNEQLILGWVNSKEADGDQVLERVTKGCPPSIDSLEIILYYYLMEEFDKKYGGVPVDDTWQDHFDKRHAEIKKLIGKRFVSD